ncbi:MAG: hypothetical protein ACRCXL_12815 [Dermatophilaceae bacterium]
MPDPYVDEMSGIRLVGGETRDTSDVPARAAGTADEDAEPDALGYLADAILAAAPATPRVLLVGLGVAPLAGRLAAAGATVDLLVRSLDDARHLAAAVARGTDPNGSAAIPHQPVITDRAAADRIGPVRVLAGVVDRYHPSEHYDMVLAPSGPTESRSPDSPDLSAHGLLTDLGRLVCPAGLLLAGLPCPSGLGALLALPSPRSGPASWHRGAPGSRGTPPSPNDAARLTGLPLRAVYGAWPSSTAPRLLVTASASDAAATRAAAAASWAGFTDALRDPGVATQWAADAGLLDALAPGRLVVLGGLGDAVFPAVLDTVPADAAAREPLHDALDGHDLVEIREVARGLDDEALRAAAGEHLRRGLTAPWGLTDAATLTGHLLAAAGRSSGPAPTDTTGCSSMASSAEPLARRAAARRPTDPPAARPIESPALPPEDSRVAPALAEARVLVAELEAAVAERDAKVRWLEGTLRTREREVTVLERAVAIERSVAYRTLRQLARPVPAVRRRARRVFDRLTGPR